MSLLKDIITCCTFGPIAQQQLQLQLQQQQQQTPYFVFSGSFGAQHGMSFILYLDTVEYFLSERPVQTGQSAKLLLLCEGKKTLTKDST